MGQAAEEEMEARSSTSQRRRGTKAALRRYHFGFRELQQIWRWFDASMN
jgi:hypothetical protein